jgi:hypothetical protein
VPPSVPLSGAAARNVAEGGPTAAKSSPAIPVSGSAPVFTHQALEPGLEAANPPNYGAETYTGLYNMSPEYLTTLFLACIEKERL